jgi:uncharacterized protein YjbI with pentapeptide repeats
MSTSKATKPPRTPELRLPQLDDGDPEDIEADETREAERFTRAQLAGRNLVGATFRECEFLELDLNEAELRSARFVETRIRQLTVPILQAAHSSWRDVIIDESRIGSGELFDTNWKTVVFRACKLGYLNLRGAKVEDLVFENCTIDELDLQDARATRVAFVGCTVGRLDISRGQLADFDLRGADLRAIDGVDALRGVTISGEQLTEFAPFLASYVGLRVDD